MRLLSVVASRILFLPLYLAIFIYKSKLSPTASNDNSCIEEL